jgi:hypothetical protein
MGETDNGSRFPELRTRKFDLRVAPVAHVLLVLLTIHALRLTFHERHSTRKSSESVITVEVLMDNAGYLRYWRTHKIPGETSYFPTDVEMKLTHSLGASPTSLFFACSAL